MKTPETEISVVVGKRGGKTQAMLEAAYQKITQLEQRLAQAERERDELEDECRSCGTCKFLDLSFTEHPCNRCVALGRRMMWQWRGVYEENSKEENHG